MSVHVDPFHSTNMFPSALLSSPPTATQNVVDPHATAVTLTGPAMLCPLTKLEPLNDADTTELPESAPVTMQNVVVTQSTSVARLHPDGPATSVHDVPFHVAAKALFVYDCVLVEPTARQKLAVTHETLFSELKYPGLGEATRTTVSTSALTGVSITATAATTMDEIKRNDDTRWRRLLVNELLDIRVLPWHLKAKCLVESILWENTGGDEQKMLF
jgi:hypothetical protein